ncbi:MAG: intradiol ring-cleavage dioxygenase [Acidimicrobiales bacterium]
MNEERTTPDDSLPTVADAPRRPTTSRRRALAVLGGGGLGLIAAACSSGTSLTGSSTSTTASSSTSTTAAGSSTTVAATGVDDSTCTVIPEETAGPYPGDGSNGVNVLTQDGIVRRDIRSSFGSAHGVAEGVPLTITLEVVDTANGCAPRAGAAVYLWHCDIDGAYSLYAQNLKDENYLRGVQETDSDGRVSFTTIFPAAYSGRWPHAHFEVYPSLDAATSATGKLATSQLAFPKDVCDVVYATSGYEQSVANLSRTSLATDMVFRDGASLETPVVTGSVDAGYVATLTVPV